ncbi:MAG: hypothetical protein CL526_12540 [Aequorivita sp.]|nr:hypothetical protein [Aequorivita sp.]|tara:strand:+ start:6032 stop:6736 length:705 start_codon:yes stop_codon:yes gene_type:complete
MKKIILSLSLALITISAFSQSRQSGYTKMYDRTIDINQRSLAFGLTEAQFEAIKDDAYANPNFLPGKIFQDDELLKDNVPMRYNAYADEIEIKQAATDESYGALIKSPDIFVKIATDIYVFIPFEGSIEKGGYFNVLVEGENYNLYKKTKAEFKEPKVAETSYQRDTPPSFPTTVTYFLVKDGKFLQIPNRKSRIMKMMDSKKSEMKQFVKQHDIDLDDEKDLIKTIKYFDSLL